MSSTSLWIISLIDFGRGCFQNLQDQGGVRGDQTRETPKVNECVSSIFILRLPGIFDHWMGEQMLLGMGYFVGEVGISHTWHRSRSHCGEGS